MIRFIAQLMAYLVGSIPFGYLVARFKAGIDIRQHGSGNIGASNVGRVLGFRYFILVFVLDFLKGAVPVLIAKWVQSRHSDPQAEDFLEYLYLAETVGFAAILGHVFPVYLSLKGGKGVSTTIGVMLTLAPVPTAVGLVAWAILVWASRVISIASIGFAFSFATAHLLLDEAPFAPTRIGLTIFACAAAFVILLCHWRNIGRIVNGTENHVRLPRWLGG